MTRDFNKQRRENERPSSRSSPSHRYGEERSQRPARPRLNRKIVDRAWENGARQNHADYRASKDSQSQSPRDSRRRNRLSDQSSPQNSRNQRKSYGNRQDSNRHSQRAAHSKQEPQPRSFESGMRNFNEQRYNEHEHRGYQERPGRAKSRPAYRENSQHSDARLQSGERDQYRGSRRRGFDRDARPSHSFDRDQRQARGFDRDSKRPRSHDRDKRSFRNGSRSDTPNPRWQSRPTRQSDNYSGKPHEFMRRAAEQELFEGDYEHFDASNSAEPSTSINAAPEKATDLPTAASTKRKPKTRTHTARATTMRDKKPKVRQSTPKVRSTGPKPSQRGFKWPTPEK